MTTARSILRNTFGYPEFRGQQAEIIDHVVAGNNALVLLPTGQGKSLCYQIPALLRPGTAVVFSPLIALMQDQVAKLKQREVRAAVLNSSLSPPQAHTVETRFSRGELDLLYVAPERLQNPRFAMALDKLAESGGLALFAIDEAHCISQWGHDFRPDYLRLAQLAENYPDVPRMALTATADELTRHDILKTLHLESAYVFAYGFDRPNIHYSIVNKLTPRRQLLEFLKGEHVGHSGIVYCLSRARVDQVAAFLVEHSISALPYHAGMNNEARLRNQQRFLEEGGIVMVATNAFGMGIDKQDIRFVAHLDLPGSIEAYYQETGRAGRDGLSAFAWLAFDPGGVIAQRRFIEESEANDARKRLKSAKLDALYGLCELASCRRVRLLSYFGEASQPCGNCDNCLEPPSTVDATDSARKALRCVGQIDGTADIREILSRLTGIHPTRAVPGGPKSRCVNDGIRLQELEWRRIIRQLLALGLLYVDPQAETLHLTQASQSVLTGTLRVRLAPPRGQPKPQARSPIERSADIDDQELLCRLLAWSGKVAGELRVPKFKVLPRSTAMELARNRPQSLAGLSKLPGISARFADQYGATLLSLLKAAK